MLCLLLERSYSDKEMTVGHGGKWLTLLLGAPSAKWNLFSTDRTEKERGEVTGEQMGKTRGGGGSEGVDGYGVVMGVGCGRRCFFKIMRRLLPASSQV